MPWSWKDIGDAVADIAPTIAGVVGNVLLPGAGGPIAAMGITALLRALGLEGRDTNDPATIEDAHAAIMSGNPETLLALKKADQEFYIRKLELENEDYRLENEDRASARAREISIRDNTPKNLAYITVMVAGLSNLCIVGAAAFGAFNSLDSFSSSLIGAAATAINGLAGMVYTYYYGSTRGSDEKNKTVRALTQAVTNHKR